jgi:hypothetical protein
MRSAFSPVVLIIALLSFNITANADDSQGAMAVYVNYNTLLPSGSTMHLSYSNVNSNVAMSTIQNCSKVEGYIRFLGTAEPPYGEEDEVKTLNVLHQQEFSLSPGEVLPLQFIQPSQNTETVIVETVVPPNLKHCLTPSSATIFNESGVLTSVSPPAPAPVSGDPFDITIQNDGSSRSSGT